ncbi:MAG: hypothetical protein H7Y42_14030 [Chitinophagaceae bacterium]|nr:hypothetical protein [Chitinophagaceae bacterium]
MRKISSLLFFMLGSFITFSQIVDFDKIVPPTPEVAHLQKEVRVPVDYSTGVPSISISLFELNTGKISVPISISYHGSGIRVGQLSSSVGLGWGLNAGGAITRSIRGKADEGGWLLNNYTNHFVNVTENGSKSANDYMLTDYDFTQDDYSYSFLGFGGSFFFDSTKTIRHVEKNPINLEYNYPYSTSKFKARDIFGFSYYFDSTDVSLSSSFPSNNPSNTALTGGTSAWKLTKIKYQAIDSVQIDYQKYTIEYDEIGADIWDLNDGFESCVPVEPGCQSCGDDYPTALFNMVSSRHFDNSLVKQIKSRDTQVDFYYSNDDSATVWKRRLDSIIVKSLVDSSIKKKVYLSYSRFPGCEQLRLKSIKHVDLNTGQFEETKFQYYENSSVNLPGIGARSKDMFGYFNNKPNEYLIVSNDPSWTNLFDNADRNINSQAIVLGTLRSVTYATGGYSEFVYEPNKINDSMYGPGLRVREVREYNALDRKLNRTAYSYFGYHGQSLLFPYNMLPEIRTSTYTRKYFSSDEPNNYNIPLGVEPMGYLYDSVVVKIKGSTNDLLTTYQYDFAAIYNGYKAFPVEVNQYRHVPSTNSYTIAKKDKSFYAHTIDNSHLTPLLAVQRPQLLLVNAWTEGNFTCVQSTTGFYTMYSYAENSISKAREQSITYAGNDSVVEESRYYYANSNHLQPTRIVRLNSVDSNVTLIKYPAEMVAASLDPNGVYQAMVTEHFWGPSILEETFDASANSLTKTITGYKQWTGFIGPELTQTGIRGTTPETRRQIIQCDAFGNVREFESDGMKNTFIWDYNGRLPVAKASNAASSEVAFTGFETSSTGDWILNGGTYSTANALSGKQGYTLGTGNSITKSSLPTKDYIVSYWIKTGSLSVNGGSGNVGMSKNGWTYYQHNLTSVTSVSIVGTATLDDLRLYPLHASMVTHSFDPLRGMISMSDQSNRITYYEYDGLGRLCHIRDMDKNIIKKIKYSVTQSGGSGIYYNFELATSFVRATCDSGYEGGEYNYKIPAGRYSSIISQTDADDLAALEMGLLGQQVADIDGPCSLSCPNCAAPRKHCINGVCEIGLKVYTSSVYNSGSGKYDCIYHYEFSDGFYSISIMEENDDPCL